MPIPKKYDGFEAYGYLFSSLLYLLKHPQYGVFLYMIGGGMGWNELSHYTGIKITIEEKAKSVKVAEPTSDFFEPYSTNPFITVQQKKSFRKKSWSVDQHSENAIVLDDQYFEAFADTRFRIIKEEGTNRILVHYAPTSFGKWFTVDAEMFDIKSYE